MNIPVIYEDDWLVVLDKPCGLLVIPTPKKEKRTLTSIINQEAQKDNKPYRFHPCHRLDRQTSGLIIYAKGKAIQEKMMRQFKEKKVKKSYLAFVNGNMQNNQGQIRYPLEGMDALTEYRVIRRMSGFTIVEAMPLTGRTNQIRIHFKKIGHPILGDTKFSFRRDFYVKAKRLMLHARRLEFIHPETAKKITLEAQPPAEFRI